MKHTIKLDYKYFEYVKQGIKNFEIRFNDRDYKVGDELLFLEVYKGYYTGDYIKDKFITYVIKDFEGLKEGWCVFGIG